MSDLSQYIDNRLKDVRVASGLADTILKQTSEQKQHRNHGTLRRCVAVSVAVMFCFLGSATALATTVPSVNDWLYSVSAGVAEMLYPINLSAEDNGIKIDVLYAANDNHMAYVYFSIQDTVGNRVDDTTDIYNYLLDGPTAFTCKMVSFDEKTNTAFFRMLGTGGSKMAGKMATFCIDSFLSNKTRYDWYDTHVNLAELANENASSVPILDYNYTGGSGTGEGLDILLPDEMEISLGVDFVSISNIGFVDGKLHIQTKWVTSVDNNGSLSLETGNSVVNCAKCENYYFSTESDTKTGDASSKHIEYVFDIASIQELKKYSLWASFTEDGNYTKGRWKVNFRLSDTQTILIDHVKGVADSIELSPIGVYIGGYKETNGSCIIIITMKDGSQQSYGVYNSYSEMENGVATKRNMSAIFDSPISLEDVTGITVNGFTVYSISE